MYKTYWRNRFGIFGFIASLLLFFSNGYSQPELESYLSVKLLKTYANGLLDSVEITSIIVNKGDSTAKSVLYPNPYTILSIGIDTLTVLRTHQFYILSSNYYSEFKDTISVLAIPHSYFAWTDPLQSIKEKGVGEYNNVMAWSYNFHPTIKYDTVKIVIIDTLRLHDTIFIYDTVKTDSKKVFSKVSITQSVYSEIYNIQGKKVWTGYTQFGVIPKLRLSAGTHLMVQNDRKTLFKITYK